jgi:hypothetical protein
MGSMSDFEAAFALGPLALLRLRAEILLRREAAGEFALPPGVRQRLEDIAVTPKREDQQFIEEVYHEVEPYSEREP